MRRVFSADNPLLAGHLCALLEAAGIPCILRNEYLSGAMGELPMNECWPEVWIADEADAARAENIVASWRGETQKGEPWTCECGEVLEGQFTACWKCDRERVPRQPPY
ncbi:MAG: DUF2007 domain-containing protein [Gammaproteobacteria bacterium]|nr:DUF2007 domain-containing protein [Gammaproteobacteria bacterium]